MSKQTVKGTPPHFPRTFDNWTAQQPAAYSGGLPKPDVTRLCQSFHMQLAETNSGGADDQTRPASGDRKRASNIIVKMSHRLSHSHYKSNSYRHHQTMKTKQTQGCQDLDEQLAQACPASTSYDPTQQASTTRLLSTLLTKPPKLSNRFDLATARTP